MVSPDTLLPRLSAGERLDEAESQAAFDAILHGDWNDAAVAGLLILLRQRGETAAELVGAARALRSRLDSETGTPFAAILDTCGTGGDNAGTFNVSTAAAIVAAACGVPVAKHGNRGVSSSSGSADVLRELGVRIDAPPESARRVFSEIGLAFFFAPQWHRAVAKVQPVRRALRFRTIFNLLGPLCNPMRATHQLVGVGVGHWQDALPVRMAQAAARLGTARTLVVAGSDGLDEATLSGPTRALLATSDGLDEFAWTPADFGLPTYAADVWRVSSPAESAAVIGSAFAGTRGPAFDLIAANAAAALWVAEKARSLPEGVAAAEDAMLHGAAAAKLQALAAASQT
jgi:anthranilate phosphoribosyltransferase